MAGEIPMPCIASLAGPRIFERTELQALFSDSEFLSDCNEFCAVGRDQVRHLTSLPDVMVQPQPAFHCVDHPIAAASEFTNFDLLVRLGHGSAHAEPCAVTDRSAGLQQSLA